MSEEKKMVRCNISLSEQVNNLLEELCLNTAQSRGSVLKTAILSLHFILTKVGLGYEVQLVNKETRGVTTLPIFK